MAQDFSDKKKSISPDLLKLMMNEDEADASLAQSQAEIELEIENEAATRIQPENAVGNHDHGAATRIVGVEKSEEKEPSFRSNPIFQQNTLPGQKPSEIVNPAPAFEVSARDEQNYKIEEISTVNKEMKMVTASRGPVQRGSHFIPAEATNPVAKVSSHAVTQVRTNANLKANLNAVVNAAGPAPQMIPLLQSEHMRIAQIRIKELEEVVETLRVDNEQLSSASETLKNRNDELTSRLENLESRIQDVTENANREKSFLDTNLKSKTREVSTLRLKVEELESRLHQDLRKIRVRERELENIIEIVRAEHAAVILNKDEMILSLKRKVDDLMHQMDQQNQRLKDQDRLSRDEHEKVKRTVKGLRAALIMLEGDQDSQDLGRGEYIKPELLKKPDPLKKVE